MTELLGDAESAQGAIIIFDFIRTAPREDALQVFLGSIQSAIDQALESRNAEVDALIAERDVAQSMLRWTYQELGSEEKLDQSAPLNHLVRRKLEALRAERDQAFAAVQVSYKQHEDLVQRYDRLDAEHDAALNQVEALRAALEKLIDTLRPGLSVRGVLVTISDRDLRAIQNAMDVAIAALAAPSPSPEGVKQ